MIWIWEKKTRKKPGGRQKSPGGGGSSSGNQKKKTNDLSPAEAKRIITEEAQQEAIRIVAELNLPMLTSGSPIGRENIKKTLKSKYGIDLAGDEKINLSDLDHPVEEIANVKIQGQ